MQHGSILREPMSSGKHKLAIDLERIQKALTEGYRRDCCHFCGSTNDLKETQFGLSRKIRTDRDWTEAIASAVASAITLPLLGFRKLSGPSKSEEKLVLRLVLVACNYCIKKRKPLIGALAFRIRDYKVHPIYGVAKESGFKDFVALWQL
jgi:hypothetical protein